MSYYISDTMSISSDPFVPSHDQKGNEEVKHHLFPPALALAVAAALCGCRRDSADHAAARCAGDSAAKVEWTFPIGFSQEGLPFAGDDQGFLVWGASNRLAVTVSRPDLWDHRGGYDWTSEQSYANIRQMLESGNIDGLNRLFAKTTPPGEPNNPHLLPLGRVEFDLGGWQLASATLDPFTGAGEVKLVRGGETSVLALAYANGALVISLPEGAVRAKAVCAWETPVWSERFAAIGYTAPAVKGDGREGGFEWQIPGDPSAVLAYRIDGDCAMVASARGAWPQFTTQTSSSALADSAAFWREWWRDAARVEIPDADLQQIYDYGFYRFGAATAGKVPMPLQGAWYEDVRLPPWNGDYHFNINVQMCYSPAFLGNKPETLRPLFSMIRSWWPKLRENARQYCGVEDGFMLPHSVDDRGTTIGGFWMGTIDHGSTAWVAQMMFRYVQLTGDLDFLREEAFPFMRGAMRVYEAMMDKTSDGKLAFAATVSPEWWGDGPPNDAWGRNASFQLAACHRLARDLVEAAGMLGVAVEPSWLETQQKLPLYAKARQTSCVRRTEWEIGLFEGKRLPESHRHHSHMAGITPFDTLDFEHDGEVRDAVRETFITWTQHGPGLWAGWSMPWASQLSSRIGAADMAAWYLKTWKDIFNNPGHGSLHNPHYPGYSLIWRGPFDGCGNPDGEIMQLDGAMGAVAAVQEMLCHERQGVVRLFAGTPQKWRKVAFENFLVAGGFKVSARREDGRLVSLKVQAPRGGIFRWQERQSGEVKSARFAPGETRELAAGGDPAPETWYHFQGANISKAGIAADFAAIARAGIGGVQVFHGMELDLWPGVEKGVVCMTPEWFETMRYAADTAAANGISFTMQNCPGWAMSGGPWIKPQDAQRSLTMTRTDVVSDGREAAWDLALPEFFPCYLPKMPRDYDYRDIAVVAFPTPDGDTDRPLAVADAPQLPRSVKPGRHAWEWGFAEPALVRTVELPAVGSMVGGWCYHPQCRVKIEAREGGGWKTVAETGLPAVNFQDLDESRLYVQPFETKRFAVAVDETRTDRIRISFDLEEHDLQLQDPSWGVKEFVRFYSGARLDDWRGQAGWSLHALPRRPKARQSDASRVGRAHVKIFPGGGRLAAALPAGKWTLLRVGHLNSMRVNAPAPLAATGWECDKLSVRGARASFAGYIGRLLDEGGLRGKLRKMIIDSWECGSQLWTEGLDRVFAERCGYEIWPYMPALFGFVVDDPATTERFLDDFRRMIGELVADNYYGELGRLARANGLEFDFETAFGDIAPGDVLAYYRHADTPMCEFWSPRGPCSCGSDRFKPFHPTVSAAKIYGKKRVAAEAFTGHPLWTERLRDLKHLANRAFIRGVGHLVFHTYPHQPFAADPMPGASFGGSIGTAFTRGQTWWKFMPGFTTYLSRVEKTMGESTDASDILWLLPDDVDQRPDELSQPGGDGYRFDFCNSDVLLRRLNAADGRLSTVEGASWRVLYMPVAGRMRAAVAERLAAFAEAGVPVVIGSMIEAPATLCGGDDEVRRLAAALARLERCGVFARSLDAALAAAAPDVLAGGWCWSHRTAPDREIYFFNDDDAKPGAKTVSLRRVDGVREWVKTDLVTGASVPLEVREEGGRVVFELELAAGEMAMVAGLRRPAGFAAAAPCRARAIDGVWRLDFPSGWTPTNALEIAELAPWRRLPGVDEETRAFSGTARYSIVFSCAAEECAGAVLDLGEVNACAKVRVNGREAGDLWCPPYRVPVAGLLRPGENRLEIEVTDSWHNRLAYDARRPAAERKTWAFRHPSPQSAVAVDSGLLGPVRLLVR